MRPEARPRGAAVLGDGDADIRTFLIADVRGYTRFTEEYGDEVAARLAAKFADVMHDGVEARGGSVIEIRGDEALAVFKSARQAIRAAVDLQAQFDEETQADSELPLRVGIGVDSGEAVLLEDGSYRGAALNIASRLCGRAHGGEVLVSSANQGAPSAGSSAWQSFSLPLGRPVPSCISPREGPKAATEQGTSARQ
jgi:adenylate cyclase